MVSMAANSCASDDDVEKDFLIFGECLFHDFDKMFKSVHVKVNEKVPSILSIVSKIALDLVTAYEAPIATAQAVGNRVIDEVQAAYSHRKATQLEYLAYKWIYDEEGVQMKETVCRAALVLYVSFYMNITRVTTEERTDRKAIETLTKVAVSNFKNWYIEQSDKRPFSVEAITEGVTADMKTKIPSLYKQTMLYDKVTGTEYDPIGLFTKPALVMYDGIKAPTYYQEQSRKYPLKYGFRSLFEHELKNKSVVLNGYEEIKNPGINVVKPELAEEIWSVLFNAIREEDQTLTVPLLRKIIDEALQKLYRTATSTADVDIDYCPAPADTFLGRQTELEELKTMFAQHSVLALVGMGGLGKTQLSRKYVQINKADYQYKYWLESETPEKLKNSFKKLANKLHIASDNIDNEVINDVYKKIQAVPTILIFDNVEKSADVYAYLPTRVDLPPEVTIHVLITSRWTDWTGDEQIQCYKLQPFDDTVSLLIFRRKFNEVSIELQNKWKELAQMLGYLPLALQVTASAIHKLWKHKTELGTVLDDYMEQLTKKAGRILKYPLTEYENRTIYESMLLPFEQFENKTDDEWKLAVTLINAAAYMNPDGIKRKRLLKLLNNDEDTWTLDAALAILTDYSLFDQVVNSDEKYYTVHRIMQASLRHNHIEKGTADMYYTVALKCELDNDYRPTHPGSALAALNPETVFRYVNDRAAAVVAHYKENPSASIFIYLVQCKAIPVVQAIFQEMTTSQIRSVIQEQDLLYHAMWTEHLSMIQLLCSNGADINQMSNDLGLPPLHHALQLRNTEIAKWLLENGAKPSVRDKHDRTALDLAFKLGNLTMVSNIIKTDKTLIGNSANTRLFDIGYAFNSEDFLSAFHILLANGAQITAVNDEGDTALHLAVGNACVPAVTYILEREKDLINIVNNNGKTALHNVCHNYARGLATNQSICSTIRFLVGKRADLAKVDIHGNTVLHAASGDACAPAVALILELKEDLINIVNAKGRTALHEVCDCYREDEHIAATVRVLVDKRSDLTKVDINGNTVLHLAARRARAAAVALLLQPKTDIINMVNADGQTALHVLHYDKSHGIKDESILQTIRVLADSGADLLRVDPRGNTVLHLASRSARAAVVSLLSQLKEDLINIVNADGQTALQVFGKSIYPFEQQPIVGLALPAYR